jgi:sulfate adenylyltransferase subunit 2
MTYLDRLENDSVYIFREAYHFYKPKVMLWSIGKDSNALVWLARKAFVGNVPFKLVHLDTGLEYDEVYEFRDKMIKDWKLDVDICECPPEEEMDQSLPPSTRAASRKTEGLKQYLAKHNYKGVVVGIRRDEHGLRGKERVFSPRTLEGEWDMKNQPLEVWQYFRQRYPENVHVRIHPLLAWTELDIWNYIKQEGMPVVPLYFAKNGKRFRSLGEKNITKPVDSNASTLDEIIEELKITKESERSGRTMDQETENSFEILRQSGYM